MSPRISVPLDSDVVVVGSGPAGAATAAHLAAAGRDVLVLDRQTFPRDKVCGDFVGPAALVELKRLGVSYNPEYRATNKIRDAAMFLDGKRLIVRGLPEVKGLPSYGRVIPRVQLDGWILDAARSAGARVVEGRTVTGFDVGAGGVTVHTVGPEGSRRFTARLLIGADGSSSTISRSIRGGPPERDDRILAVRAYFEGIEPPSEQADLYFTSESFPGYYWLFPTGNGAANVGVGMLLSTMPPTSDHLRALLLRLIEADASLRRRLGSGTMTGRIVGWPLTTYNHRLPLVADRVMLVGDAAGLINPLNGEGIQYALLSGRWAAEVAHEGLEGDDLSLPTLSAYAARVGHELRYDMALATLVVQLIRNRHLNPLWLHTLKMIVNRARSDPDYAQIVGSVLAGLIPASDAVTLRVIASTVEQAAMSLGFSTVWHALGGPKHLAAVGADTVRGGWAMLTDTTRDPAGVLRWGVGVAAEVAELTSQIAATRLLRGARSA